MLQRNVVDELHDDDGLAHTGPSEEADFAAPQERLDQVNDLDTGLEHFHLRGLLVECRRLTMDGIALGRVYGSELVDRVADNVHHAPQRLAANGYSDRAALIDGLHATHHALGRLHGDTTHAAFAELLLDFQDDVERVGNVVAFAGDAQRRVNRWQRRLGELHVHRGTCDLNYVSDIFWHMKFFCYSNRCQLSVVSCQLPTRGRRLQRSDKRVQHSSQFPCLDKQAVLIFLFDITQFCCDYDLGLKFV